MRLLVTGGAGSLGSNLIEHLADRCDEVLVIDNFATGKRGALLPRPNLTVVEGSIVDAGLVRRLFDDFGPSHVVHSAASYKDPSDWTNDSEVNILGTINVVRSCEAVGVRRLVNFQTALCYGRPTQVPIPVDHPTAPFTSYGISKTAGEEFVRASDTPWVSLRLANVTGPRLAIGPIPTFYKRLKADEPCTVSTTVRDFLDMSDFLSLMDIILENSTKGVFNVSTGRGHTIEEIFRVVATHVGRESAQPAAVNPPGPDDVPAVVLDPRSTFETFGWRAAIDFPQTVGRLLAWYDVHGVTDIYSHLKEAE